MSRGTVLLYGILAYLVFFGTFLYAIGFLANYLVPKGIDTGTAGAFGPSLAVDLVLLGLFAVQHSVMARPAFKRWWTRVVPEPVERSTYVLLSSLVLILLFWQWRPLPETVWAVESPTGTAVLWGLYALGWVLLLIATFLVDHFDLFGLRQVYLYYRGKPCPPLEFKTRGFYRFVRHPIMASWVVIFWATPHMTVGHLAFAIVTTAYILAAIQIEERDLERMHGEAYAKYRRDVSMLFPLPRRNARVDETAGSRSRG